MSTPVVIPYTPPRSIGQEVGVLFGFAAFMVLVMGVYLVVWKAGNKRSERKENDRRETLAAKGIYEAGRGGGGYVDEKSEKGGPGIMETAG